MLKKVTARTEERNTKTILTCMLSLYVQTTYPCSWLIATILGLNSLKDFQRELVEMKMSDQLVEGANFNSSVKSLEMIFLGCVQVVCLFLRFTRKRDVILNHKGNRRLHVSLIFIWTQIKDL